MKAKRTSEPAQRNSSSRGFEKELAAVEALSESLKAEPAPDAAQIEELRKALGQRNNFIVSKAARLVADAELVALLPEVLAAFDRFFVDAAKTDPKCWAKEALAKALVKLEYRSKDTYLRGMRHQQMEPSFGPPVDTAGALRGTCTHALVDCPGISDADLLTLLLEPLTDADKSVRIDAARAIGNVGGVSAVLLLRLRALLGSDEPEVLGEVYAALLSLEGAPAIPLVAQSLKAGDELAAEAAYALAGLRTTEALAVLQARMREGADEWFGAVLLSAIALTRLPEAMDLLVSLIERDAREAVAVIEAIGRIAPNAELRERVERAVEQADSPRLRRAFQEHMPSVPE
ncbi:MAG: HEAT repeat domain-containing protein [Terracidiphilus sp.]|jgi:HEAT repeat protein